MKVAVGFDRYDAELDTDCCDPYDNAELTITLKMGFRQINPTGGAEEGTYHDYGNAAQPTRRIIKWTTAAWELWKREFCSSAQAYWHGKFWLVNNFPVYEYEVRRTKYRPNVWCRFALIGSDADRGLHHHTIDVVRLHRSETWFGSHSTLYDSLDTSSVQKNTDSHGHPVMQRAHVHEVGHLLGLPHVDVGTAACPATGDTNASACYGTTDVSMNSVMGSGMQLRPEHAVAWRRAIVSISGKGAQATATDWQAKLRRHYPRIPSEVAANAEVIHHPHRP